MDLGKAIESIFEGQAVLFAGAGFSFGAHNAKGEVPSAKKLKVDLLESMGKPVELEYGLEIVAEFFKKNKSSLELVKKLKEQYNIIDVADHHRKILGHTWKRIYTTNYDQVIEKASKENGTIYNRDAIILSDDFELNSKTNICVHLNGYIERLNENKLNNEFKLTDRSYSCDTLVDNPWFEFMINDFEAASAIIVIGYSMQFDIDIKRLFSAPRISEKVVFIDAPDIDDISKELLENYGSCFSIGIEKFAKEIEDREKNYVPSISFSYKSFRESYHNTLTSMLPTYEDIVEFYIEGKSSEKMFAKTPSGEYKYILARKAMNLFLTRYKSNKVFIALSNLGNGKSVFLSMIENELMKEEVKVYTYVHRYDSIDQEIEKICNENKKRVVIIDNYPGHMDILHKFCQYGHSNITFLLTARNGVNLMFCKQLERALRIHSENIYPLYLNQLQENEISELSDILENNSLLTSKELSDYDSEKLKDFITINCRASFSDLLLKLFEKSHIRTKLMDLYGQLENIEDKKIKEVVIFSLLKNISNYDLNFYEILDLFKADYIALKRNEIEFIPEIFVQGDDNGVINVRSSIVSIALIQNVIKTNDIIDVMKKAFVAADKKNGRTYVELQKSMVSHSQFIYFTNTTNETEKLLLIEDFYDYIRNTKFAKHNPFFWEQFASAYIDLKKFNMVEKCIENALIEASNISKFVPFQVKTVQGRYFVEKAYYDLLNNTLDVGNAIGAIVNATDAILQYYTHPENNLYYVFKVVRVYAQIFAVIKDKMDNRQLSIYIEKASIMSKRMDDYVANNSIAQYNTKVNQWNVELKNSLDEAKGFLKK